MKKFDAPKATLMSYIIKGILGGKLPWGLVLLGVMIAHRAGDVGHPVARVRGRRLPAAVVVDADLHRRHGALAGRPLDRGRSIAGKNLTEEQLVAEGDKSPGVLMASGYIAGGAIAGIIIAFLAGVPLHGRVQQRRSANSRTRNPLISGANADLLSLIPFVDPDRAAVSDRPRDDPRASKAQA